MKSLYRSSLRRFSFMRCGFIVMVAVIVSLSSCKKLVEVDGPKTNISAADVYATDATAIAVLNGIYSQLGILKGGNLGISYSAGLSADEFTLFPGSSNPSIVRLYTNALSSNFFLEPDIWNQVYTSVYTVNSALDGLSISGTLTPAVKQQLLGEARFIRAFLYFYLVNLYGDVPLALTTDQNINGQLSRTPAVQVWQQIINDLLEAETLLSDKFLDGTLFQQTWERVRPTKGAAQALLARAYLFTGDWTNAAAKATEVIENANSLFVLATLDDAFLMSNAEAIWQIQPVNSGWNTFDAVLYVLPPSGPNDNSIYLNQKLVDDFEDGDLRRTHWIDSVSVDANKYYYPFKYKVSAVPSNLSEYPTVLRLGEQYLIRAEARTHLGNFSEAVSDIDALRTRAGLLPYSGVQDEPTLLADIAHERRVELFSEWGHRWLDLKRTGAIDAVMTEATEQKGGTWSSTQQLYPLHASELSKNHNLVQNPGYN